MTSKIAFVTGATRGIGAAIARQLAEKGYHLAINGRDEMLLCENARLLSEKYSVVCLPFPGDIGDAGFVKEVFEKTEEKLGGLDVLVNNAGISYVGLLTEMEPEAWERVIRTNLTAVFLCSKFGTKQMLRKKRGKIINISSVWGAVGASCEAAYSASKGGVNAFTRALGKELAPSNIQVNAIACGIIDTDMNRCFSEEERYALKEEVPAGRFGSPEEIARVALSLVEAPSYLTGQIITVDGGWI